MGDEEKVLKTLDDYIHRLMRVKEEESKEPKGKEELNLQHYISRTLSQRNITYIQMDGIKNISNYKTFKEAMDSGPVLLIVGKSLLGNEGEGRKESSRGEPPKDYLIWIEKHEKGGYIIHEGNRQRRCSRWLLMKLILSEKKNQRSKYLACAPAVECSGGMGN